MEKPLLNAFKHGHKGVVLILLEAGADLTKVMDRAILEITGNRNIDEDNAIELIDLLIEAGANIRANDDEALIRAVDNNLIKLAYRLIELGADILSRDNAVLLSAIDQGNFKLAKFCLENGADISARNGEALLDSIRYCEYHVVEFVVNEMRPIDTTLLSTAFILAAEENETKVMRLLHKEGANINHNYNEALISSILRGDRRTVNLIKEFGTNMITLTVDHLFEIVSELR